MTIDFDVAEHVKTMTLQIHMRGFRKFKVRLWFGALFVKLGAAIIGCKSEIA